MYCSQCGNAYPERVNFCSHCGAAMFAPRVSPKRLTRSRRDEKIAGVCGGIAEYLGVDSTLVRLAWVMMALFVGWGVVGYLIAWLILPEEPEAAPSPAATQQLAPNP